MRNYMFFVTCLMALAMASISCAGSPASTEGSENYQISVMAGSADGEGTRQRTTVPVAPATPATPTIPAPGSQAPGTGQNQALSRLTVLEGELNQAIANADLATAFDRWVAVSVLVREHGIGAARITALQERFSAFLRQIRLEQVAVPPETIAGTAFRRTYDVRVSLEREGKTEPLSNVPVTVTWPLRDSDGQVVPQTQSLQSDPTGLVQFSPPLPTTPVRGTVIFSVLPAEAAPDLHTAVQAVQAERPALLSLSLPWQVLTNARPFVTTISILDFDKNNRAVTAHNVTATALLRPMIQRGFARSGMADFPTQLASGDEAAIIRAARAQFGGAVRRFVYGTTRVESLAQGEDGRWTCVLIADISVWDFTANARVAQTQLEHRVQAASEWAALDTARKEMGADIILNDLLYRM